MASYQPKHNNELVDHPRVMSLPGCRSIITEIQTSAPPPLVCKGNLVCLKLMNFILPALICQIAPMSDCRAAVGSASHFKIASGGILSKTAPALTRSQLLHPRLHYRPVFVLNATLDSSRVEPFHLFSVYPCHAIPFPVCRRSSRASLPPRVGQFILSS